MGTTVRELIDLAGGVKDGKKLLAFAPGGASSNFLPADKADVKLDFAELAKAGLDARLRARWWSSRRGPTCSRWRRT